MEITSIDKLLKKLRCGKVYFAKVALECARKSASNLGLANVPIRGLDIVCQNQNLLPRTSTLKI